MGLATLRDMAAGRDLAGLIAVARRRRLSIITTATTKGNAGDTRFQRLSEQRAIVRIWTMEAKTIEILSPVRVMTEEA
jgi:hypothetical protein